MTWLCADFNVILCTWALPRWDLFTVTFKARAINRARQLSSPERTCGCYIDRSIESLPSEVAWRAALLCECSGIKVGVRTVRYWDSIWGLFACIFCLLVSRIALPIRLNGLFVSCVILSHIRVDTHTHTHTPHTNVRTGVCSHNRGRQNTDTHMQTHIQSRDFR